MAAAEEHPWAHLAELGDAEVSRHLADVQAAIRRVERWLAVPEGDPDLRNQNAAWLDDLRIERDAFQHEYDRRGLGVPSA